MTEKTPDEEVTFTPIGIIHSPFSEPHGTPIQPTGGRGVEGTVEIYPEFAAGLKDLDGFSHLILLFHFHLSSSGELQCVPYMDDTRRGVFATRSPRRPNPIGLSVVRLISIEDTILHVRDLDIVDGTPLLDIKPYVPPFDEQEEVRIGWLASRADLVDRTRDDGRFARQ